MPGQVTVERFLSRERECLIARADFAPLFAAYLEHSRKWVGDPQPLVRLMMAQGLAASGLYLTCRPRDENTAWTLNLPEPPLNLFLTADAATGKVVGRYFEENVKATGGARFYVQAVRRSGKPHMSVVGVKGFDVLSIFEQYYVQSEQATARFFSLDGESYVMLMALPGVDEAWLRDMDCAEAMALLAVPETQLIERRTVSFGCRCNRDTIVRIVKSMFAGRAEELFGDDGEVEMQCPRCGRSYDVARRAFESASDDEA